MTHETISNAQEPARVSRLAIVALVAAIAGAIGFLLVIPALIAFIIALVAQNRISKRPAQLAGMGYANAAVTLSLCSFCFSLLVLVLMPSRPAREIHVRSYCGANLRGIMQSLIVYATENNDAFPVMTYAPYSPALNNPTAATVPLPADKVLDRYYQPPFPQAGSVVAPLWMLVLRNSLSPKQLICKSDPTPTTVAKLQTPTGDYYDNFQNGTQLSYSAAYPWKADGTVGKWWTNTTDSSLPLLADMAPQHGTGTPLRDLTTAKPKSPKAWSSDNHQGDGQNVAFADAHTEFTRRPDIGQDNDNIWTTSGMPSTGPAATGGIPATRSSPMLTVDKPPFDIIMYPTRNATTGSL